MSGLANRSGVWVKFNVLLGWEANFYIFKMPYKFDEGPSPLDLLCILNDQRLGHPYDLSHTFQCQQNRPIKQDLGKVKRGWRPYARAVKRHILDLAFPLNPAIAQLIQWRIGKHNSDEFKFESKAHATTNEGDGFHGFHHLQLRREYNSSRSEVQERSSQKAGNN